MVHCLNKPSSTSNDKLMEECEQLTRRFLFVGSWCTYVLKSNDNQSLSFHWSVFVFTICLNWPFLSCNCCLLIYRNYYDRVPAEISYFFTLIIKKYITSHCFGLNFHQFETWKICKACWKRLHGRGIGNKQMLRTTDIICIKSLKYLFNNDPRHSIS